MATSLKFLHRALVLVLLVSITVGRENKTIPSVIIIGAGPSGIAAATRLLDNNFTNVIILEAEGRIGGRIHSIKFGDGIVDLGAQWCHGQNNNIVFELANKYNLLEPDDLERTFYHSSREVIDPVLADEIISHVANDIYYDERQEGVEMSMGQYVITRYFKKIIKNYGNNYTKLKLASEMLDYVTKNILEVEGAFSLYDVSAHSDYTVCEGPNFHWKGRGYKTILDVLLKSYPNQNNKLDLKDKLKLNKVVTKVNWNNERNPHQVAVTCEDGSIYKADHVIFTPSLGVLKKNHKTLFEPQLPDNKVTAINNLGIAAVAKLLLHFPQKWWPAKREIDFSFVWDEEDSKHLSIEFPYGANLNARHWLMDLIGFSRVIENPNVLLCWFTGESVPLIETLPDEVLTDGVMFVLQKFVGHLYNISSPEQILRTKWYTNPHFLGTYSFQTVESCKENISGQVTLSQPLSSSEGYQTLLFAGEATHPIYFSTVHGAIESGYREANRIISLYKQNVKL